MGETEKIDGNQQSKYRSGVVMQPYLINNLKEKLESEVINLSDYGTGQSFLESPLPEVGYISTRY
jgi:hypothetical protein